MIKKQNAGELDQFYTNPKLAKKLIKNIDLSKFKHIIEPSAGDGSFSLQIPNCEAYDLEPKHPSIEKANFLKKKFLYKPEETLLIGNPPFGRQSTLAFKFINHGSTIANTIAFILPKSFKKDSLKDRIPIYFHCILEIDLEENCFLVDGEVYSVPCVFQIWEKQNVPRKKTKKYTTNDFIFCDKNDAELSIRRVGVYAGDIFKDTDKSLASFYFIKSKKRSSNEIFNIIKNIDWNDVKNNTVGIKSISKNELIKKYLDYTGQVESVHRLF